MSVLGKETLVSASQLLHKKDPAAMGLVPPIAVRLVLDRSSDVTPDSEKTADPT